MTKLAVVGQFGLVFQVVIVALRYRASGGETHAHKGPHLGAKRDEAIFALAARAGVVHTCTRKRKGVRNLHN